MSVRSFPREDNNFDYTYKAGPKKEVVLMGTRPLTSFLVHLGPYRHPERKGWRLGEAAYDVNGEVGGRWS